jgi:hypothetical protein
MKPDDYVADFDSSTAFLRALGRFLHGQDFPSVGAIRWGSPKGLGDAVSALPRFLRRKVYAVSGALEGITPRQLGRVRAERVAQWTVEKYPRRKYPAVMLGSSGGAFVHLCAALGIPWLPQTFLVPVRARIHPDDPQAALAFGRQHAPAVLGPNPELRLHHMHDPAQDRLMLAHMTYFRFKRLRVGETFTRYLTDVLPPGGTIFVSECRKGWPVTRVGRRHVFQMGALGGPELEEYFEGSARIARYLADQDAQVHRWDPPVPDELAPEAEWGLAEELLDDVRRLARDRGYRLVRIAMEVPEDLSPLVADLYRWWYWRRRIAAQRLLVESFVMLEPYWTLRTGSVPFWMKFNMEDDADRLEQYLDASGGWRDIHLMLFQHGMDGPGVAPVERWRELLERAEGTGEFLGVDPAKTPIDFAAFVRYHTALRALTARHPLPGPLTLDELERFISERGADEKVRWIQGRPAEREGVQLQL